MNIICPYASTALFAVGSLGIPATQYAPFAFFQWACWALAIILPMFGLTIVTKEKIAARSKKRIVSS